MKFKTPLVAGVVVAAGIALGAHAEGPEGTGAAGTPVVARAAALAESCNSGNAVVPLASEVGSSGIMYNIAEHPKSIRAVARRLLDEALSQQQQVPSGDNTCRDCDGDKPRVVYEVAPIHLLPMQEQQAVCRRLDAQTKERPFEFAPRHFKSVDALNDWVMGFSQGRGEEGKELYERCEANCSPSYEFTIEPDAQGLQVETRVHCGLARDRDNSDYQVSTALRLECGAPARSVAEVAR